MAIPFLLYQNQYDWESPSEWKGLMQIYGIFVSVFEVVHEILELIAYVIRMLRSLGYSRKSMTMGWNTTLFLLGWGGTT